MKTKQATKRVRKAKSVEVDTKKMAANDKPEVQAAAPVAKLPDATASAVKSGAQFAVLAGRPSKQAVTAVFGKSGYALSWVARAKKMGVTPESLCARFKDLSLRDLVKSDWEAVNVKKEKAATPSKLTSNSPAVN